MRVHPTVYRRATLAAVALATVLAPLGAPAHAANTVLFRAKWTVGERITEIETSKTTSKLVLAIPSLGKQTINDVSSDSYTITISITKVYPDGSALASITFPNGVSTDNGKTTKVPLTHYYRIMHIAADGKTLSSKTYGAGTVPASLRDGIPDTQSVAYPDTPVAVGATWTTSIPAPPIGTLTAHNTLLGVSSTNGRPVATIHAVVAQPVTVKENGATLSGPLSGTEDQRIFADSFADAAPGHVSLHWSGKLSGTINGTAVTGTFLITSRQTTTPLS